MSYTITDVREIERMTQGGGKIQVRKVYFVTARGGTGSIEVALDEWDAEILREKLETAAAELDLPYTLT